MPTEIQKQGTLNEIIVTYKRRPIQSARCENHVRDSPSNQPGGDADEHHGEPHALESKNQCHNPNSPLRH